jgi:hypothetical protein
VRRVSTVGPSRHGRVLRIGQALSFVLFLVTSACISSEGSTVTSLVTTTTAEVPVFTLNQDDDVVFEPAGRVAAAREAGASEAQVALLADGLLTFAEYRQAVLAMVACSRLEGVEVVALGTDRSGGYPLVNYAIPAEAAGMTEQDVLAKVDGCGATHSTNIEIIWQLGHSRTDEKFEKLYQCLEANGVEFIKGERVEALEAANELLESGGANCVSEAGF